MKKIVLLFLLFVIYDSATAQSYTGNADYLKANRTAVICEVTYPGSEVEAAIEDSLAKLGYKSKSSKGFNVYKGVRVAAFSNEPLDLYFSVDRKSKKEKEISVVTFLISKGGENFVTAEVDKAIIDNAKTFLNGFVSYMDVYDLEQQINAQQEVTAKAEKKANNLSDEADALQKKMKRLAKDIEENAKDQVQQKAEVEKQRLALENLKSKRKQ